MITELALSVVLRTDPGFNHFAAVFPQEAEMVLRAVHEDGGSAMAAGCPSGEDVCGAFTGTTTDPWIDCPGVEQDCHNACEAFFDRCDCGPGNGCWLVPEMMDCLECCDDICP